MDQNTILPGSWNYAGLNGGGGTCINSGGHKVYIYLSMVNLYYICRSLDYDILC